MIIQENESKRDIKLIQAIREKAAEYLQRESNQTSLITVTDVKLSKDGKHAKILFSVLPTDKEIGALNFAKRHRSEFYKYFIDNIRIGRPPLFDFEIDSGEKNRQKIDDLINKN